MDPILFAERYMNTLIIVVVVMMVLVAILGCVAFYRGAFRLRSTPNEHKVQFVLMRKKETDHADAKTEPEGAASAALKTAKPLAQTEVNH